MAENCGYWLYLGANDVPKADGFIKEIDPAQLDYGHRALSNYTESQSTPRILTRAEKGQALTHLEMDFNLASLFHKLNTSSLGAPWTPEENSGSEEGYGIDVYFERHKPTRAEEMAGMFATFSYAPVTLPGGQTIIQNGFQTVKIQHTTDEIRYKLSNEMIPGTLDIEEDFHVSGSAFVSGDLYVSGSSHMYGLNCWHVTASRGIQANTLEVSGSAGFVGNTVQISNGQVNMKGQVNIDGNLYVNGRMVGNLSNAAYGTPDYATPVASFSTLENQSDARLKDNLVPFRHSLAKLSNVEAYEFDWKAEAEKEGHDVGLIAQELQGVYPEAVSEGQDGYLRIDYAKVIPLLVSAINELSCQVDQLKRQLNKA